MFARNPKHLIHSADMKLMRFVANRRNPLAEDAATALSSLCSPVNTVVFLLITSLVDTNIFWSFTAEVALTWSVVYGIKFLISRERPEGNIEAGLTPSFPSAHSATAFILASIFSQMIPASGFLLYSLAVSAALSRIYLQTHYLSDVAVGSVIGVLAAVIL